VCIGESVTLTAEPGYSSYVWSNGATTQSIEVSVSGSYFVTAASNLGCDAVSNDVVISIIQPPTAAFSYDQVEPQNTVQFTYTGAYGNDFIWNFGGGVINNSENPLYQFPYEGTWPVTLIVSNECGADTFETEIEVIKIGFEDLDGISVDLLNDGNNWIVKGSAMGKEPLLLEVWSIDGRIMYSTTIQGNIINEQIGFSNYTSGIYMISLSRSGKRSVAKVIRR
jgi:PKD repeat protein